MQGRSYKSMQKSRQVDEKWYKCHGKYGPSISAGEFPAFLHSHDGIIFLIHDQVANKGRRHAIIDTSTIRAMTQAWSMPQQADWPVQYWGNFPWIVISMLSQDGLSLTAWRNIILPPYLKTGRWAGHMPAQTGKTWLVFQRQSDLLLEMPVHPDCQSQCYDGRGPRCNVLIG